MISKFDARQTISRDSLDQVANAAGSELDNILRAANSEFTVPFVLRESATPDLILNIGNVTLVNPETSRNRTAAPISNTSSAFTSGTVTFPASSGGNAVPSAGDNVVITITSGSFLKVGISIASNGDIVIRPGIEGVSIAAATIPPVMANTYATGFVILENVAGTIQNITSSDIFQYINTNETIQADSISSTTTAAGTTTLTNVSSKFQRFTGVSIQNVDLPDATTLINGHIFQISNRSTDTVTVRLDDASTSKELVPDSQSRFVLVDNSTANGTWDVENDLTAAAKDHHDKDLVLFEDIDQRQGVGINSSGEAFIPVTGEITASEFFDIRGPSLDARKEEDSTLLRIGSDKVLDIYWDETDTTMRYRRGTELNNEITWESSIELVATGVNFGGRAAINDAQTKILFSYEDGAFRYIKSIAVSGGGSTLTIENATDHASELTYGSGGGFRDTDICYLPDDDRFLLLGADASNSGFLTAVVINATTATPSTNTAVVVNAVSTTGVRCAYDTTEDRVIAHWNESTLNGKMATATTSTTSTVWTASVSTSTNNPEALELVYDASLDRAILVSQDNNRSLGVQSRIALLNNVSGTLSIVDETVLVTEIADAVRDGGIIKFGSDWLTFIEHDTRESVARRVVITTTTITVDSNLIVLNKGVDISFSGGDRTSLHVFADSKKAGIIYTNSAGGLDNTVRYQYIVNEVDLEQIVGINIEDGLLGETKTTSLDGSIISVYSGQTKGANAYFLPDGTVSEFVTPVLAGVFISDTELKLILPTFAIIDSWLIESADAFAAAGDKILANSSGGIFDITLPANPKPGDSLRVVDGAGDFDINPVTLLRNGRNIQGIADNMDLTVSDKEYVLVYRDSTYGWRIV